MPSARLFAFLCIVAVFSLQNLPGDTDPDEELARQNGTAPDSIKCTDDVQLLRSLSGRKDITCEEALRQYRDQDAGCREDLGFGPLSTPCPVTCGLCRPEPVEPEDRRAAVVALEMIRGALAALTEAEQAQVMAGLWQDAERKGMAPNDSLPKHFDL